MKEYIEREALIELIEENSETKFDWSECVDIDILRPAIRDIPAADVVPVTHGEWIDTDCFDSHYQPIYECSHCHKQVADNYISYHKYCLHCGAKMNGRR